MANKPKTIITEDGEIKDAQQTLERIELPFFKTPYNHDRDAESARTGTLNLEPTRTQQHQAEEADINTIVRRFGVTGQLPQVNLPPTYADFSEAETYEEMMNIIAKANSSFYGLPADIRAKFSNNPGIYTTYLNEAVESGNIEALQEMGLQITRKPGEPDKVGAAAPIPPDPTPQA